MTRKEQSRKYYLKNREKILKKVALYRAKNKAIILKKDRLKYSSNEEERNRQKQYQVEYRKNNKEKVNAYQRKYRLEKYKEYHNEWKRKWGRTPKGKLASSLKGYRRRALLKNSIGNHTDREWQSILNKYSNKCANCKKKKKLTKDHIVPLSKGGMNTADNLQPLCQSCNSKKGDRISTD